VMHFIWHQKHGLKSGSPVNPKNLFGLARWAADQLRKVAGL